MHALDLMEPEQTVGDLWHGWAMRLAATGDGHADAKVALAEVAASVAALTRALGGPPGIEVVEAPPEPVAGRRRLAERVAGAHPRGARPTFDGERLRLPPRLDLFPTRALNRTAYLWLAALAVLMPEPRTAADPFDADLAHLDAIRDALQQARTACPGLAAAAARLHALVLADRPRCTGPSVEQAVESRVRRLLGGADDEPPTATGPAPRGYAPMAPVPVWPRRLPRTPGRPAAPETDPAETPAGIAVPERKAAARENRDEASRRDSFIVHRFEGILSWAESLNLNRLVDDDDAESAAKAAEDQARITLSEHARRVASRLRLSLDLAPADAHHERIADAVTYPEWNHRLTALMPDHVRVLEAEGERACLDGRIDARLVDRVRRQFEALAPRHRTVLRQIDGPGLDLDAVIAGRAELRATGRGSDRVHIQTRPGARDLAVAVLVDCSRSTEAMAGNRAVLATARDAVAALGAGIDALGDALGIWGFASLRRDRVFLTRCKGFEEPFGAPVMARIAGLRPGHYTRLGAAIRHGAAQLRARLAERRLLLVLTDGKPNDLDHYEGVHGIEDSRAAVREARSLGLAVHGVVIDADGQDWFARIFGRDGFSLLTDPVRLPEALPHIYRSLTLES